MSRSDTDLSHFEELYLAHFDRMELYVNSLVNDMRVAEDICAESYLRAAQRFPHFDSQSADFESWLLAIAKSCTIEHFATLQPTLSLDNMSEDLPTLAEDPCVWQQTADYADMLLDSLTRNERKLVYMRYYEQKRNVQIAHELGLNQSTVASRLQRALDKMRSSAKRSRSTT